MQTNEQRNHLSHSTEIPGNVHGIMKKGQFPSLESESNYIRKYTNLEIAQ